MRYILTMTTADEITINHLSDLVTQNIPVVDDAVFQLKTLDGEVLMPEFVQTESGDLLLELENSTQPLAKLENYFEHYSVENNPFTLSDTVDDIKVTSESMVTASEVGISTGMWAFAGVALASVGASIAFSRSSSDDKNETATAKATTESASSENTATGDEGVITNEARTAATDTSLQNTPEYENVSGAVSNIDDTATSTLNLVA